MTSWIPFPATWATTILGDAKGVCVHARGVTVTNVAAMQVIGALYLSANYTIRRKRTKALRLAVEHGNAVPPLLAEHVLAMAAGIERQERETA